ncbi:hypothetical protein BB560_001827, partial [Smittium megazygosporum]
FSVCPASSCPTLRHKPEIAVWDPESFEIILNLRFSNMISDSKKNPEKKEITQNPVSYCELPSKYSSTAIPEAWGQ